jgi:hypothetical protein
MELYAEVRCLECCAQVLHDDGDMLGKLSHHISLQEACFWLSVTNLTTIGYGNIVRLA